MGNVYERVVKRAVAPFLRRCAWAERADLEQEAWVALLDALPRYDERRPLEAFLFVAATNAVHRYVWRSGAAVHVTVRNAGDLPREIRRQRAITATVEDAAPALGTDAQNPERVVGEYEARSRVRERLDRVLSPTDRRLVEAVLLGGEPASAWAARRGVCPRRTQERVQELRERLAEDPRLLVLHQQLGSG